MLYAVVPGIGVGSVMIGMARVDSRSAMGVPWRTSRKAAAHDVDAYHENSFQIFFDEDERVSEIEVSRRPSMSVPTYRGIDILAAPAQDALEVVSADAPFDPHDPELGWSYYFPALGLWLWRESIDPSAVAGFDVIGVSRPREAGRRV